MNLTFFFIPLYLYFLIFLVPLSLFIEKPLWLGLFATLLEVIVLFVKLEVANLLLFFFSAADTRTYFIFFVCVFPVNHDSFFIQMSQIQLLVHFIYIFLARMSVPR